MFKIREVLLTRRLDGRVVLFILFIDYLSVGIAAPVLPRLIQSIEGSDPHNTSLYYGWCMAIYAVMLVIASPVLGALSDSFGRKPIICVTLVGAFVDYVIAAFATSVWILLIARGLTGACGANNSTAAAYIIDSSAPEERSKSFARLGAIAGLGLLIGPIVGALLGGIDLRYPFLAAAAAYCLSFIYCVMFLPESLSKDRRKPFKLRDVIAFKMMFSAMRDVKTRKILLSMALLEIAILMPNSIFVLYVDYRFNWSIFSANTMIALMGAASIGIQALLVGRIVKQFGEIRAIIAVMMLVMTAYLMAGFAGQATTFSVFIAFSALAVAVKPMMRSLLSQFVPDTDQGVMQGAVMSVTSLAAVGAPLIGTFVFHLVTAPEVPLAQSGLTYVFAAALILPALVAVSRLGSTGSARL